MMQVPMGLRTARRRISFAQRRSLLPLSLVAACATLLGLSFSEAFVSLRLAPDRTRSTASPIERRAKDDEFSYSGKKKAKSKGFSSSKKDGQIVKKKVDDEPRGSITESASLAKDERQGRGQLTKSKLQDLRDKTLAQREKREAELDEYEEGRALIAKYGPEAGVMPKKVAERTAKRGMVIGGAFYGVMLGVVAFGIILYKTQEVIIPPTLMVFITLSLLALSILGSSYGMMSASWDPDSEGSLLGTDEFSKNMGIIGEGLRRGSMQQDYDKAIGQRQERRALLEAKEEKKKELLNK